MKRFLVFIILLGLAGAGYWYYQNQRRQPVPEATEVAPHRWQVHTTRPAANDTFEENATADENSTEENATNATVVPEDAVVEHGFVRDVSKYLAARYLPAGVKRNPSSQPRFDLNVKSMNIRYNVKDRRAHV